MYIATQFPLENTVNDFWRMIWEKKSNCVVMLANEEEDPVSRASIFCLLQKVGLTSVFGFYSV